MNRRITHEVKSVKRPVVVGQQEKVALYSGIDTRRIKLAVFAIGGALVGLAVALYVFLSHARPGEWARLVRRGLLSSAGFIGGALLGTPALLLS